jgi:magnesium-transporting ATPase (P-type)
MLKYIYNLCLQTNLKVLNVFYFFKLYTAIPPLIIGLFLNTYSADKRLKNPQLYMPTKNIFNYKIFWVWIVVAVFHSMFIFWICLLFMKHEVIWTQGIVSDYSVLGNAIYTVIHFFINFNKLLCLFGIISFTIFRVR